MWCTRWFLPLLLLPLPTAPPYFLLLFIFSLTMHAKPCFYCIVLISSIFVSSCYWQPFSLDMPLASPWAENISTYGEALYSTLSPQVSRNIQQLPQSIRAVDRCWCDLSSGSIFDSFNVTKWEHNTVNKVKDELERQWKETSNGTVVSTADEIRVSSNQSISTTPTSLANAAGSFWSSMFSRLKPSDATSSPLPSPPAVGQEETILSIPSFEPQVLRRKVDLNPYGINMLVDFGWSE